MNSNHLLALCGIPLIVAAGLLPVAFADGRVASWGSEIVNPQPIRNAWAVAGGSEQSLALLGDGSAVAWGRNNQGQATIPSGLNRLVAVAGGNLFNLALVSDGTVVSWGADNDVKPPLGLSGVTAISAGDDHALALKADGTLVAWGNNFYGQATVPDGLSRVVAMNAGHYHNLAAQGGWYCDRVGAR